MPEDYAAQYAKICLVRPALNDFNASPLVLTGNPTAGQQALNASADPASKVPFNGPAVPIETDLFVGHMTLNFRGLPGADSKLFEGKKRTFISSYQGKFKRPVAVADLMIGSEFFWSKDNPPYINGMLARLMLKAGATVTTSNGLVEFCDGYMCSMAPVAAGCQILNVSREGEQPAPMQAQEDARLLCPGLADKDGQPLPPLRRRKLLDTRSFTKDLLFGTEHVYTFLGWQHHVDFEKFKVDLAGFMAFDLAGWLPRGAPLLLMIKDVKGGDYMVNAAIWHKQIVELAEASEAAKAKKAAAKGVSKD